MNKLIFIYNAESGKLNALMDSLHKLVSPSTYSCKLCELTFGSFGEKNNWKEFRENLEVDTDFMHKDEFLKLYASKFGHKFEFPVVLAQTELGLEVFIANDELQEISSIKVLMAVIRKRIELY